MPRFLSEQLDLNSQSATITDSKEIHHIKNVLRLKPGDSLSIFDGRGKEAFGEITQINTNIITIKIKNKKNQDSVLKTQVTLACAIPKKAKFETIIEKCTELGIYEIIPLITKRTEVRLPPPKRDHKAKRYRTVAVNAAKQSQRRTVPIIHAPMDFKNFLEILDPNELTLIPHLLGPREKLQDMLPQPKQFKKITYVIGPEGDFTPQEIEQAKKKGCIPITLGPTTLKVDTAAISVMAFINLSV